MNRPASFLGGLAVGVGLMYLIDPNAGARRRALMRDQAVRGLHRSSEFLGKARRDLRHRASGVAAGVRHRLDREIPPDDVLVERVRSRMGRNVSHPRAIEVT